MSAAPILQVEDIAVTYSQLIPALRGVSLTVPSGAIVALLGGNGAGKTTTLKAISNLIRAERGELTAGRIAYRGNAITERTRGRSPNLDSSRCWRGGVVLRIYPSKRICGSAPSCGGRPR